MAEDRSVPSVEITPEILLEREVERRTKEIMHAMEVVVGIYGKRRKYRVPLPSGEQAKLIVTGVLSADDCKVLLEWVQSLCPGLMASDPAVKS